MDRFFVTLLADKKAVGSTPKYSLLNGNIGFYFFFLHEIEKLLANRKAVDSIPKYSLLDGNTNQASIFSPCIRYK